MGKSRRNEFSERFQRRELEKALGKLLSPEEIERLVQELPRDRKLSPPNKRRQERHGPSR